MFDKNRFVGESTLFRSADGLIIITTTTTTTTTRTTTTTITTIIIITTTTTTVVPLNVVPLSRCPALLSR